MEENEAKKISTLSIKLILIYTYKFEMKHDVFHVNWLQVSREQTVTATQPTESYRKNIQVFRLQCLQHIFQRSDTVLKFPCT